MDQPDSGLIPGTDDNGVDVDVARAGSHEGDDLSDILGTERSESLVDLFGPTFIPIEAYEGELGLHQPGIDFADANRLADEFHPQHVHDGPGGVFCSVVAGSSG